MYKDNLDKLLSKRNIIQRVEGLTPCWEWTGYKSTVGEYAQTWIGKSIKVHRLIAQLHNLFTPEDMLFTLDSKYCVCHHCDNRICINPSHLWIGTSPQNTQDKVNKGRQHRMMGENHPMSKITNEQADEIRKLYSLGYMSQAEIGFRYNMSARQISEIVRNKSYVHHLLEKV